MDAALACEIVLDPPATQRTRNRVREHGPTLYWLESSDNVSALSGRPGHLFRSRDGWKGWLPDEEIRIIRKEWLDLDA